ncbi:DNA polymerase/3'-5' exonuclease PolX [Sporomusa aerivorans]|uniref:DNA polymerase/3'-5' exonuclease PolX n=1 Tax=Sporomusa aerivorans TaxID=204936 RepID=UPI00352AE2D8
MADKNELVRFLAEIAVMLELSGESTFKIRAYQNAARLIDQLNGEFSADGRLAQVVETKGIGPVLREKILEYITTGRITYYEELKTSLPPVLFDLLKLPGVGPKKALVLKQQLGVNSLGELEYACRENRLVSLKGFGQKSQERILQGIEDMKKFQGQFILGDAWPVADLIVEFIKLQPGVVQAAVAGDIRRGLEIIRDIEIVAACSEPAMLAAALTVMPGVSQAGTQANDTIALTLSNGLGCRVYITAPAEFVQTLFYYTGSEGHIARLAVQAESKGLQLSPAGICKADGGPVPAAAEQDIYTALAVSYIEPELREDEAVLSPAGTVARPLVTIDDIRGVFHVHTTYSDGSNSLADMAAAAHKRGWQYLGIADHSQTAVYAGGLRVETVLAQRREIEKLNAANSGFVILTGIESDILPDGTLDYPDEILASFDFVVASVHSAFRQSEADMTRRIIRAVENRYVTMLGHPTGRLLLGRKGYAVNLAEVIQAAAGSGTMIEINASPYRLDLDWRWCRTAKEKGVLLAINPDAHAVSEFEHLRYGLASARKAALTACDIINSRPYPEVLKLLQCKR